MTQKAIQKAKQAKRRTDALQRIPENVIIALRNRRRLIQQIGTTLFDPEKFRTPSDSIFL